MLEPDVIAAAYRLLLEHGASVDAETVLLVACLLSMLRTAGALPAIGG